MAADNLMTFLLPIRVAEFFLSVDVITSFSFRHERNRKKNIANFVLGNHLLNLC